MEEGLRTSERERKKERERENHDWVILLLQQHSYSDSFSDWYFDYLLMPDRWLDRLMKLLDQVAQIECYFAKCAHVPSRAICVCQRSRERVTDSVHSVGSA